MKCVPRVLPACSCEEERGGRGARDCSHEWCRRLWLYSGACGLARSYERPLWMLGCLCPGAFDSFFSRSLLGFEEACILLLRGRDASADPCCHHRWTRSMWERMEDGMHFLSGQKNVTLWTKVTYDVRADANCFWRMLWVWGCRGRRPRNSGVCKNCAES